MFLFVKIYNRSCPRSNVAASRSWTRREGAVHCLFGVPTTCVKSVFFRIPSGGSAQGTLATATKSDHHRRTCDRAAMTSICGHLLFARSGLHHLRSVRPDVTSRTTRGRSPDEIQVPLHACLLTCGSFPCLLSSFCSIFPNVFLRKRVFCFRCDRLASS